ncbi:DNA adenine methylase [Glutamicibacter arilaitensis]|uniref:DNA adenine methylase n=1 Tax=Glutamicibacter arilaitensis TaxID=256701 RepID=UPI003FD55450
MGSKSKLLTAIEFASSRLTFDGVCDPFAGTGVVSYMYKALGSRVRTNDHMKMNSLASHALIENSEILLDEGSIENIVALSGTRGFISRTFEDIYFSEVDNNFLDATRLYIDEELDGYAKSIAITALVRACVKKRPRGIFTYTGTRYNDGRRDLALSLRQHFVEQCSAINSAVFDNGLRSISYNTDALSLDAIDGELIYLDPPYFSEHSDNDYVRRYHFVEGLARNWEGLTLQAHTKTKKFRSYETPFSTRAGTYQAFEKIFSKYSKNPMLLSYSSNSLPSKTELENMLRNQGRTVEVTTTEHLYSFGTQNTVPSGQRNRVQEYLFIVT